MTAVQPRAREKTGSAPLTTRALLSRRLGTFACEANRGGLALVFVLVLVLPGELTSGRKP